MAKTINWYEQRVKKKPKNDFCQDFSKLMNNVVFGKTGECEKTYKSYKYKTYKFKATM